MEPEDAAVKLELIRRAHARQLAKVIALRIGAAVIIRAGMHAALRKTKTS